MEEVLARHRKEVKELTATVTGLKKQAKADKKKKKEITKQIEDLETELKRRHEAELSQFDAGKGTDGSENEKEANGENDSDEDDEEVTAEKLLAQLELDQKQREEEEAAEKAAAAAAKAANQQNVAQKGPKRNRRKEKLAKRQQEMDRLADEAASEAAGQTDYRKIEMENMDAVCKLRGLVQHEITPDGHCLFASIADQLERRHGTTRSVQELRSDAAGYIRSHPDTFQPFLFDENTMSMREIEPYCDEIETTALWGGDMEILALAMVYNCCISVMMSGRPDHKVNEDGTKPELKLAYYKHSYGLGEHYNSLRDSS